MELLLDSFISSSYAQLSCNIYVIIASSKKANGVVVECTGVHERPNQPDNFFISSMSGWVRPNVRTSSSLTLS
jgi:hypothetical protein